MVRLGGRGTGIWLAIMVLASCQGTAREKEPSPSGSGPEVPAVALQRLDGTEVLLSKERDPGKPLLLVFMTAWCSVCRAEQPAVERFAEEHPELVSRFILSGSALESAEELAEERELGLELLVDAEGAAAEALGVVGTPTFVLYKADGRLAGSFAELEEVATALSKTARTEGQGPRHRVVDSGRELGTSYDVLVIAEDAERARRDLWELRQDLARLERQLSEWREDSEIAHINRVASQETVSCSDEMMRILKGALHVSRATGGCFDITWRPLGELWDEAERRGQLPTSVELAAALELVGSDRVELRDATLRFRRDGVRLGIAGVAKGWIIDVLAKELEESGYRDFVVNLGGDVRVSGRDELGRPWRIAVRSPFDPTRSLFELELENGALATSGNAFRYRTIAGRSYGHLLDPRTGQPAELEGSVTVLAPDAAMADALATALFVMGPIDGLAFARRQDGLEALYVTRDGILSTLPAPVVARVD
ncbi:MAG: FAD:protein FMN transferase [Planctomycetota bacterium]